MPTTVLAIAAHDTSGVLKRLEIERRTPEDTDVDVEIKYCGICHSDLHQIRSEWAMPSLYPMVPGHEIVGIVRSVGKAVTKFKIGDRVGVGCLVDSCRECASCKKSWQQYCGKFVGTYNGKPKWYGGGGPKTKILPGHDAEITFGGYSQSIVVDQEYVVNVPDSLDLAKAAPLLCAGITTYSPLSYFGAKDMGSECTTGVVGFGGLGHMAVKIAKAMGNKVMVFSTSPAKKTAVEALGAQFVCSSNAAEMQAVAGKCNFIIDTVSGSHEIEPYINVLTNDGKLCVVGAPSEPFKLSAFKVIMGRKTVCGSLIGGIQETQEMLDFCAAKGVSADVKVIHPKELNHAMLELERNAAGANRFVIDIAGLVEGAWEVEDEPAIDPTKWTIHGFPVPAQARHPAHAK